MKMFADIRRQQSLYIRQLEDKLSELLMYTTGQKHSEINCGIEQMRQWVDDWRQDVWGEIERLERELEESEKRETGLSIMLTSAQSAAEMYKRERDAAVADMERMQGLICQCCKEYYQPDPNIRKWTCRVYGDDWATISEDGVLCCGKFKWRGLQEEQAG